MLLGYEASGTQLKVESTGTDGGESLPAAFDPATHLADAFRRTWPTPFARLPSPATLPSLRASGVCSTPSVWQVLSPFNEEKLNLSSEAEAASALREAAAAAAAAYYRFC